MIVRVIHQRQQRPAYGPASFHFYFAFANPALAFGSAAYLVIAACGVAFQPSQPSGART
jgi:hypothetical protein